MVLSEAEGSDHGISGADALVHLHQIQKEQEQEGENRKLSDLKAAVKKQDQQPISEKEATKSNEEAGIVGTGTTTSTTTSTTTTTTVNVAKSDILAV